MSEYSIFLDDYAEPETPTLAPTFVNPELIESLLEDSFEMKSQIKDLQIQIKKLEDRLHRVLATLKYY